MTPLYPQLSIGPECGPNHHTPTTIFSGPDGVLLMSPFSFYIPIPLVLKSKSFFITEDNGIPIDGNVLVGKRQTPDFMISGQKWFSKWSIGPNVISRKDPCNGSLVWLQIQIYWFRSVPYLLVGHKWESSRSSQKQSFYPFRKTSRSSFSRPVLGGLRIRSVA